MVVNNIGRAETGIVAGNFMGVLHSVVTNHKFNQIFLRRMNNTTNFHPENSPHRTNFRSKFRVAFTPSRNLSPKVRDELLLQDNKGGGELFNSAVYLQY